MGLKATLSLALVVVLLAAGRARGDFDSDRAECMDQLIALMPCLAFVENSANKPTPDCCTNAKTVAGKSYKCVCVLVKDRNEPGLGFKINVTRAITLPAACNVQTNISECPKLLKLQPSSPAAQEFYQLEKQIGQNVQASTKSSNNVDASNNNMTASSSWISKRMLIGEIDMTVQLGFLFCMVFLIWGN